MFSLWEVKQEGALLITMFLCAKQLSSQRLINFQTTPISQEDVLEYCSITLCVAVRYLCIFMCSYNNVHFVTVSPMLSLSQVVELLLAKGANFEHRNVSDYTPLSLAASGGYVNIIKLLLRAGADINSRYVFTCLTHSI